MTISKTTKMFLSEWRFSRAYSQMQTDRLNGSDGGIKATKDEFQLIHTLANKYGDKTKALPPDEATILKYAMKSIGVGHWTEIDE